MSYESHHPAPEADESRRIIALRVVLHDIVTNGPYADQLFRQAFPDPKERAAIISFANTLSRDAKAGFILGIILNEGEIDHQQGVLAAEAVLNGSDDAYTAAATAEVVTEPFAISAGETGGGDAGLPPAA